MEQMKNICGKIPVELHEKVRLEIESTESSTQKFIQQVIEEHFMRKGETSMEEGRTVAVKVSEELFGRLKAVLAKNRQKQKDFLTSILIAAIEAEEARWKQQESGEAEEPEIEEETEAEETEMEEAEVTEESGVEEMCGIQEEESQEFEEFEESNEFSETEDETEGQAEQENPEETEE